jgi:formylglycine-generating enzyme required for sulfatase activity
MPSQKIRFVSRFSLIILALGLLAARASAQSSRLSVAVSGGSATLSMTGSVSSSWTIQYKTNLSLTSGWLPLTGATLTGGAWTGADPAGPATGRRFYQAVAATPPVMVTTNMVWFGPGTFKMGSPAAEVDRQANETLHLVTLTRGFFCGQYPVTQGEFLAVVGGNPSYFNGLRGSTDYGTDLTRPVEQVTWYDAVYYCWLLTQQERAAGHIPTNWTYRLPTEAEWEYACRAGVTNRFSYGDDPGYADLANHGWYAANSGGSVHPVGEKIANPAGLYDVHGNVYQWCQDWYGAYPVGHVIDPQGPSTGSANVFRGGGWYYAARYCRSAGRYSLDPTYAASYIGFRVVLAPAT